jgi:hypothetical protein
MPEKKDVWWKIDTADNLLHTQSKILQAIQSYCLPEFNKLSTLQDLIILWNSGVGPGLSKGQRADYLSVATSIQTVKN